jgi:hypothetical protein
MRTMLKMKRFQAPRTHLFEIGALSLMDLLQGRAVTFSAVPALYLQSHGNRWNSGKSHVRKLD